MVYDSIGFPHCCQWIAEKGDTLWGKWGADWQSKTGYVGDPTKLQIGERVGDVLWTTGNGNGADINAFPDTSTPDYYGNLGEDGKPIMSNIHKGAENFVHSDGENGMPKFIVAGHGNEVPNSTVLFAVNGKGIKPETLAKAIKNNKNYTPGQEIQIISCFVGRGPNCYAQQLANALGKGSVVWAPGDAVIVSDNGDFKIENGSDWIKYVGE